MSIKSKLLLNNFFIIYCYHVGCTNSYTAKRYQLLPFANVITIVESVMVRTSKYPSDVMAALANGCSYPCVGVL